jgi:hypothetical protein
MPSPTVAQEAAHDLRRAAAEDEVRNCIAPESRTAFPTPQDEQLSRRVLGVAVVGREGALLDSVVRERCE